MTHPIPRAAWLAEAALVAIGLWLAAAAPLAFAGGTYDDLLYIRLAASIAHGQWLGAFDQLTLARGPAFPVFLAGIALLRIPVNLACQAIYLAGCILLARQVGRALASRAAGLFCLAVLAVNPLPLAAGMALVLREKLYLGLTVLALALALRCLPTVRAPRSDVAWAGAAGLAVGAFWLTREEGVWLLPSLLAIVLLRLWRGFHTQPRGWLATEALVVLSGLAGFAAPVLAASAVNQAVYGVFRPNDLQFGPYPAAYGAMLRVENPLPRQRFVPVARASRLEIYAASPTARTLQPFLEGATGAAWQHIGCAHGLPVACDDLQAGWFEWALRQAVTDAGLYRDARATDEFYRRITAEIDAACAERRLRCLSPRSGQAPPLSRADIAPFLRSLLDVARSTLTLDRAAPGPLTLADPSPLDVAESRAIALGPASVARPLTDASEWRVAGWVDSRDGTASVSIEVPGAAGMTLRRRDDPGIPAAIGRPDSQAFRFAWVGRCAPSCRLLVSRQDSVVFSADLAALRPGSTALGPDTLLNIDSVQPASRLPNLPMAAARLLWRLWRALAPVALPLAIFGIPLLARWTRGAGTIAAVLLLALAAHSALLALIDATSFPALELRFLALGDTLALALAGTVLPALVLAARDAVRRPTAP